MQHFYDFSICEPGEYPTMLKGLRRDLPDGARVSVRPDGIIFNSGGITLHYWALAGITANDMDVVHKCTGSLLPASSSFTNTGPHAVIARATGIGTEARPNNCYYASTNGNTTTSNGRNLILYKNVDGAQTQLGSIATGVIAANTGATALSTEFLIRLQCVGTTIRTKIWEFGTTEPDWQITVTDTSLSSGDAGVLYSGYDQIRRSVYLAVGTDADLAPSGYPGGMRTVAGTVKRPDDSPAVGYKVRCYLRGSGILLAETISGALGAYEFQLPIPESEFVYCVGVDQVGNEWGADIADLINPSAVPSVNYSVYGAMAVPIAYDGSRFLFSCAVDKLSTSENYRAVASALSADTGLTLDRSSRLPVGNFSDSFSAIVNGANLTLCQSNQFMRAPLSSVASSKISDWTVNTYTSFPVAGVGGGFSFAKLAYDGSSVFTFDTENAGIVFKSADGITFSEPSTLAGTGMRARCGKFIGTEYIIGGEIYKRSAGQVDLMISSDLISFTARTFGFDLSGLTEGQSAGSVIDLIGFGSDIFAIVSITSGDDIGYNIMRSSDGGATWVKTNPVGWVSSDQWQAFCVYSSNLLVIGKGKTASSTDGASWTVTPLTDAEITLDMPIVGGTTIVCRGRKSVDSPVDPGFTYQRFTAWKSTDGIAFTELTE